MTNIPAGWYPDPSGTPRQRWWDGVQWSEHYSGEPAPYVAYPALTAPAGTNTSTPFIWVLVFSPILTTAVSIAFSLAGSTKIDLSSRNVLNPLAGYSPAYYLSLFVSLLFYLAFVLISQFDYRALSTAGVPRPFHWAWSFLGGPVYVIGRSVVVQRRTGTGLTPLWIYIVLLVLAFIISFVIGLAVGVAASRL